MKCTVCTEDFDPSNLQEVCEHEHFSDANSPPREGKCVARTYTLEKSVNVAEIRFNHIENTMDVTFRNEKKYRYFDIPVEIFNSVIESDSPGAALLQFVKGRYRYACHNGD